MTSWIVGVGVASWIVSVGIVAFVVALRWALMDYVLDAFGTPAGQWPPTREGTTA